MAAVIIENGSWQDAEGNPLAGGTVEFQLSANSYDSTGTLLICAGQKISFVLDDQGNVPAESTLWSNDSLVSTVDGSTDTFYLVTVSDDVGQRVWGPNAAYILGNPCNLSLLVPVNPA